MTKRLRAHPTKWQLRHGPHAWMVMCRFESSRGRYYAPMGIKEHGVLGRALYEVPIGAGVTKPAFSTSVFHTYEDALRSIRATLKLIRSTYALYPSILPPMWAQESEWCIVPMRWENPHK